MSSHVSNALERLRRAYCLRHYGKVQIGGPTNQLVRFLGITTSPFAWALNVSCVVLMFAVEMAVESEGTNTVRVGIPRYGEVKLRPIEPYNLNSWSVERGGFMKDFVHCSVQNRTHILVWPTELVEEDGRPRLSCPRNVTTQNLWDNERKATVTSMEKQKKDMAPLQNAFGAPMVPIMEVPNTLRTELPKEREIRYLGQYVNNGRNEERYLIEFQPPFSSSKLVCIKKTIDASRDRDPIHLLLGCFFDGSSKGETVLYHITLGFSYKQYEVFLAPVAVSFELNRELLVDLLQRTLPDNPTGRRWPLLFGAIMTRMANDGNLKVRSSSRVRRVIHINGESRPVVEIWVLVLVPTLLILLASTVVLAHRFAIRLFPFKGIVGEDNMIRIWARENRQKLRSDPKEPSWLALVDDGDAKRLKAFIEEPGSRLLDKNARIRGVR